MAIKITALDGDVARFAGLRGMAAMVREAFPALVGQKLQVVADYNKVDVIPEMEDGEDVRRVSVYATLNETPEQALAAKCAEATRHRAAGAARRVAELEARLVVARAEAVATNAEAARFEAYAAHLKGGA